MNSCPFCNTTIDPLDTRCSACDALLPTSTDQTVDSAEFEPFGVVALDEITEPAAQAAAPRPPKRRVPSFLRKIVDRTVRRRGKGVTESGTGDSANFDSKTFPSKSEASQVDLTLQRTQATFLDDTDRKIPPVAIPPVVPPPDLPLIDAEDAALEPLVFDEEEVEGARTMGVGDFTIAFVADDSGEELPGATTADRIADDGVEAELAPELEAELIAEVEEDLAFEFDEAAADSSMSNDDDLQRTIAQSDLTIAFPQEEPPEQPIAGVIGVPSVAPENDEIGRTATDSDFTVAFDPAAPIAGAIRPAEDEVVDDNDPNGTRRLSESDFTVAFMPEPPSPAANEGEPFSRPTLAADLTLDSADLAAAAEGALPGRREATESDYTFAFVEGEKPKGGDVRATHGIGATLNADELPAEEVERLTGMWEATISPEARPGMTIKTSEPGSASQTHLVVRPRTVRAPEEPSLDSADYELLEMIGEGGNGRGIRRAAGINRSHRGDQDDSPRYGHRRRSAAEVPFGSRGHRRPRPSEYRAHL